jgi:hypothetical protein
MNQLSRQACGVQELRSFGLTVGAVFLGIGLWPVLWSGADPRLWALALGAVLMLCAWIAPRVLAPAHRGWTALGHVLGWINTRIILGLFFYGLLTPMALAARLMGKDFMRLKTSSGADTYRVVRSPRTATHVRHQF